MAHSKTSRFRISRCKHGTRAVKLRLQGLTFEEIGKRLNCSSQRAYQIVKGELELETRKRRLAAGQLMQVELARLEEAHKAIYPKVKAGDLGAIAAMVKLCERRAKLLGLDVPDRSPQAGYTQ